MIKEQRMNTYYRHGSANQLLIFTGTRTAYAGDSPGTVLHLSGQDLAKSAGHETRWLQASPDAGKTHQSWTSCLREHRNKRQLVLEGKKTAHLIKKGSFRRKVLAEKTFSFLLERVGNRIISFWTNLSFALHWYGRKQVRGRGPSTLAQQTQLHTCIPLCAGKTGGWLFCNSGILNELLYNQPISDIKKLNKERSCVIAVYRWTKSPRILGPRKDHFFSMLSVLLTHLTSYVKTYTQDIMSCVGSSIPCFQHLL